MNTENRALSFNRRSFLKTSALAGLGLACPAWRAAGANGDIRVAVIGLGGKGGQHAEVFAGMTGVRVAALCDVDPKRLAEHVDKARKRGHTPAAVTDPRRVLERADVDAVIIATPNHWHALLAVWALRAGKDVYVEKPVSHNVWEGGRIVEEAKANHRIVQAGTQYRSCPGLRAAADWLQEGHIGKVLWGQIVWYEHRPPIGKCAPFKPDWLDYDLYCGPAPAEPLTRPKLHYDWHWVWSTGDGDLGNSGIHAFDACRMFLPGFTFPRRVLGMGGRFTYDDAAQTPNTQFSLLEYPSVPILIENRNLSMDKQDVAMGDFRRIREGFVLQFEGGYFGGLRNGGSVLDNQNKEIKRFPGDGGGGHTANFIKAVRSRRTEELRAPVIEGHISSAVCHLGNFSYRLGTAAPKEAARAAVSSQASAGEAFDRLAASLEGIGVDLDKTPFAVGPWLEVDPATGDIVGAGKGEAGLLERAKELARGTYRAPYAM